MAPRRAIDLPELGWAWAATSSVQRWKDAMAMTRGQRLGRAIIIIAAWFGAARSHAAENAQIGGQQILDMIAGMSFKATFSQLGAPAIPTGPFSSWTADQQHTFPTEVAQVCAAFWTFAHDAPGTKFLPASLSDGDEGELGLDVCLVSHLPVDWPGRTARLQSATAILARAAQAGSSLHLPSKVRP